MEADDKKRLQHYKLNEQDKIISRSYWLCLCMLFLVGLIMMGIIFHGTFKHIELAHAILTSVFGCAYVFLVIIMLCYRKNAILRVPFLLCVSFFVGIVGGFLLGVNLKMVAENLNSV